MPEQRTPETYLYFPPIISEPTPPLTIYFPDKYPTQQLMRRQIWALPPASLLGCPAKEKPLLFLQNSIGIWPFPWEADNKPTCPVT